MNAIITLLASLVIAVFFLGPHLAARFAIEWLIVKQPAKAQTSTEEFARALFFSVRLVGIAAFLVWLYTHQRYVFDPEALDRLFASDSSFQERWSALPSLWPVRDLLVCTYLEVLAYVGLVWLSVRSYVHSAQSATSYGRAWALISRFITSPYLKSEWDVLASGILLPPETEMLAAIETKGGKIFLGTLADVRTNPDGSLRHLQLSKVSIRVKKNTQPGEAEQQTRDQPYIFQDSYYFVVFASEISNVNLRFAVPDKPNLVISNATRQSPEASISLTAPESSILREQSLEDELTGLSDAKKRELMEQLGQSTEQENKEPLNNTDDLF